VLERIDDVRWRVPRTGRMRVEGLVFADDVLVAGIRGDPCVDQVANVAQLPGIVGKSMAMPDVHWGYGFPIGGVAAFDAEHGVVSPGGVGYDINCGVRLLATPLAKEDLAGDHRAERLMKRIFEEVPCGVGSSREDVCPTDDELRDLLTCGATWAVERGFGSADDLAHLEAGGRLPGADERAVSARAKARGRLQLGTLGSGNHFCEVGRIDEIHDAAAAKAFGLALDQVVVLIHTGSRGLGHQTCDDHLAGMVRAAAEQGIDLPDRQLCCARLSSPEGRRYLAAMAAAANFAFANRQLVTDRVRRCLAEVFGAACPKSSVRVVYDVCHNIAKMETHVVDGRERRVCVHRKGATRAFPPGHPEVPEAYRAIGQPVLVPGDMGRCSYVLVGTEQAMRESFGSCCHGAGRRLSRHAALRLARPRHIARELAEKGIFVRAADRRTVDEEMPEAYKDVANVVDVVHRAGLARRVARIRPIGVTKG
jgi:tRNA-splicing ligase RtcB (3'-phosphate/5'-hydroxy nucleic acid ligase)